MRRRVRPFEDPELVELLRDRPDLLLLADRLAAAGPPRRRLALPAVALLVLLAALAAGVALVVFPRGEARAGVLERALSAVGAGGPVVHVVVAQPTAGRLLYDLATRRFVASETEVELWFDEGRRLLHTVVRRDGTPVSDILESEAGGVSPAGPVERPAGGGFDPWVEAFAREYRRSLAARSAIVEQEGTLAGQRVVWLHLPASQGSAQEVALDAVTLRPVGVRPVDASGMAIGATAAVRIFETVPRGQADLEPAPARPQQPSAGRVTSSTPASAGAAEAVLGIRPVWAGERVAGLPSRGLRVEGLARRYAGPPPRQEQTSGVSLLYGAGQAGRPAWTRPFLLVQQARAPEPAYGFLSGDLALDPLPREGVALVETRPGASGSAELWVARVRGGGLFVGVSASSRAVLVAALDALAPVP